MTQINPHTFRHAARLEALAGSPSDFEADGGRKWEFVCDLWCSITPMSAEERVQANGLVGIVTHKIRTHWRPELFFPKAHTFRVIAGHRLFDVKGVIDVEERRRVAELTCTEKN
jgi:SPP1 family predicted phage head-tail adaptor